MAEIDVNAYATTAANAAATLPSIIETQQPAGTGALRQVMTLGDPSTRANMAKVTAAGELVVAELDTAFVGTISATDIAGGTPTGTGVLISAAPTANSFVFGTIPGGTSQIDLQILGTATGAYWFEYSIDSTTGSDGNWITGLFRQAGINNTVLTLSATTGGVFRGAAAAYKMFRVRNIGGTTPSNAITMRFSDGSGTVFLNASLPTGGNVIGKTGIDQTTPGTTNLVALAANQSINAAQVGGVAVATGNGVTSTGSQRVTIASDNAAFSVNTNALLPVGTTTGDTGAKTATFNGATQTNTSAKGAALVINVGAITGTSPTLVVKMQGSVDGGTTFYDIPQSSTAILSVSGIYGLSIYPGLSLITGTTTSGSMGSIPQVLPRTWRLQYVIGGTTPSFTITNVQLGYLL